MATAATVAVSVIWSGVMSNDAGITASVVTEWRLPAGKLTGTRRVRHWKDEFDFGNQTGNGRLAGSRFYRVSMVFVTLACKLDEPMLVDQLRRPVE